MSVPRLIALAVLLAIAGCGERSKLERLPADAVVLAFGDSLTFGTGADENESYPAQLEQLIGRRVIRAGIPGEVTAQALARLPAALEEHSPRLLLLCIGGNDFLRRLGNRQAKENVRAMVNLPYEAVAIGEVLKDSKLKSDPIHPNARGYRIIAERLAAALKKSGAI